MAVLTTGFTFNPGSREIVFSGVAGFNVAYLQKIVNKSTNAVIYDENDPTLGFLFYSGAQCFFATSMSGMTANDVLSVTYGSADVSAQTVTVNGVTQTLAAWIAALQAGGGSGAAGTFDNAQFDNAKFG